MAYARREARSEVEFDRNPSSAPDASRAEPAAPLERAPAIRWVIVLLGASWILEVLVRMTLEMQGGWFGLRGFTGLLSYSCVMLVIGYVLLITRTNPLVHRTVLASLVMTLAAQVFDIVDSLPAVQHIALLAELAPLHRQVEYGLFLGGAMLLVAGCVFAIIDAEEARRRAVKDRSRLAQTAAERKAAQQALQQAQVALERDVAARTAAWSRANEQLRVELAERQRAEERLAVRLRYEEGLSACSQILLSSGEPDEAVGLGLHELLKASQSARVYLYENAGEPGRGLCARLTHGVCSTSRRSLEGPAAGALLCYGDGLEKVQSALASGKPYAGSALDADPAVRERLRAAGIESALLMPVGWEGGWRGFLGFDQGHDPRAWSDTELRLLRTGAEMVAACRERQRAEETLRRAYAALEDRVAARTQDLLRANERLQREIAERERAEEETHHLEKQLRQAQKMQAVGTLAGGIAHDFNNILASILGFAELAHKKTPPDQLNMRRYMEEVLKAGNRAKELVRQILLFSRQGEREAAPVHPHALAHEVLSMLRVSCPANIELRHRIDPAAGAVLADAAQLHQALVNLCNNAQQAMKTLGGVLEISVQSIDVDHPLCLPHGTVGPGAYVLVAVSDTGSGMEEHTIERIFDPFFTTKDVGEGTGLGLSMVHGIVTALGGVVAASSARGAGTALRMYLPRCNDALALPPASDGAACGFERVLVVDDEVPLLTLWSELLESLGYRVAAYCDPVEALEAFRVDPGRFDVVLLDEDMPGITGLDLADRLLRIRPELPVLLATGFSERVPLDTARAIGVYDVLRKPILGNDLSRIVRNALDASAAARPARAALSA